MNVNINDPALRSWVADADNSEFPIQNLPFGIFKTDYLSPGAGVAIGDFILDLTCLQENDFLDGLGLPAGIFNQPFLNDFFALGREAVGKVRERISELLRNDNEELRKNGPARELAMVPSSECQLMLPVAVPNYTDFYSSREHATNVGRLFRDPQKALLPNWKHLPVGYHGRASSIVVSGTDIHRPSGQYLPDGGRRPVFGPTMKLDFELELAFITCRNNAMGHPIPTNRAEEYIIGFVLFNDWSARDFQTWEYVPLGPFQAKSFASSMSPWVITLDALEPFRVAGPEKEEEVLPYLKTTGNRNFDIRLEAAIVSGDRETIICRNNFRDMYWNSAEQLAHQTINGCNVQVGDVYASGTVSGPAAGSEDGIDTMGSLLELTENGAHPLKLNDGTERSFLMDNDVVILRGFSEHKGVKISFGNVTTKILPGL